MKDNNYSTLEEKINICSHALGFIFSLFGTLVLIRYAYQLGELKHLIGFGLFGLSMMILFLASTLYHYATNSIKRARLRIFDHASIYVLIAGTYTPFCLLTLSDSIGELVFFVVWGFALVGISLKFFFTGRFSIFSTAMYLFMGWMMIFIIKPLYNNLPIEALYWLFAGGLAYTIGAILYSIKSVPFNHACFHILVLVGCFCHYMGIYLYVF